jgi:hypothetical protein
MHNELERKHQTSLISQLSQRRKYEASNSGSCHRLDGEQHGLCFFGGLIEAGHVRKKTVFANSAAATVCLPHGDRAKALDGRRPDQGPRAWSTVTAGAQSAFLPRRDPDHACVLWHFPAAIPNAVELLDQTLNEEKKTDDALSKIAGIHNQH